MTVNCLARTEAEDYPTFYPRYISLMTIRCNNLFVYLSSRHVSVKDIIRPRGAYRSRVDRIDPIFKVSDQYRDGGCTSIQDRLGVFAGSWFRR
jgi:hypothetical protein